MSETGQATRESAAVAAWTVLLVMLGFLGFVAVSLVALQVYLAAIGPTVAHPSPRSFPEPRIGSDTPAVRQHLMNEQRARLSGYGWVDRERGLIRIPIERAMEL